MTNASLKREMIKGSPEYSVVSESGQVLGKTHCVHLPSGRFTVIVGGKFAGIGTEQQAIAKLRSLISK